MNDRHTLTGTLVLDSRNLVEKAQDPREPEEISKKSYTEKSCAGPSGLVLRVCHGAQTYWRVWWPSTLKMAFKYLLCNCESTILTIWCQAVQFERDGGFTRIQPCLGVNVYKSKWLGRILSPKNELRILLPLYFFLVEVYFGQRPDFVQRETTSLLSQSTTVHTTI